MADRTSTCLLLLSATYQPDGSFVGGRDGEVSDLDLPDLHGIEPVVWLHS